MEGSGTLIVRAFAAQGRLPVPGAVVAVTRRDAGTGNRELLFLRSTGASGATQVMTIAAPPRWESQQPMPQAPFAVCDIWVEHPEYVPALIEDAQIFAGVETVQNVQLVPLAEQGWGSDGQNTCFVTPQSL